MQVVIVEDVEAGEQHEAHGGAEVTAVESEEELQEERDPFPPASRKRSTVPEPRLDPGPDREEGGRGEEEPGHHPGKHGRSRPEQQHRPHEAADGSDRERDGKPMTHARQLFAVAE